MGFFEGRTILVTGASSGIGLAIASHLCEEGANILACGRDSTRLDSLCSQYPAQVIPLIADLAIQQEKLPAWVKDLSARYGPLDGLVCSAGVDEPCPLPMLDAGRAREIMAINWLAPVFLAKGFADRRVNAGKGSAMVFVASIAAQMPFKGQLAYAASKAALVASCSVMALELGKWGIRANCISPGFVATPMTENLTGKAEIMAAESARTAIWPGKSRDIANLAAFLLSDKAAWITGQNYVIDGGRA